ncbi:hypothetical protein [Caulobacter sp. UNC279MFTsu5.1]|uniref:hypothetical protein n=1 Tax=Caulobacter sp. UNC279MFTsu5.1 TaxID=1502775 RepID=UPI0008DF5EED|nr:hypothetical protein [Caulobacter sp. UNC279MFTsu5.1]SFJ07584.1 hypothetical protein SAMN02799626_01096 [Caulobacter sp. UNC279MFTsu5.1]
MPRSKTRARVRAARPPVRDSKDPMDDDRGRTPARMNHLLRDLRRRLRLAAASRAAAEARADTE